MASSIPLDYQDRIIQDHLQRMPLKDISVKYNLSKDRIRGFLQRKGKWIPYKKGKISLPEDVVVELYKSDVSIEDIAKQFGTSTQPIIRVLKEYNVRKPNWAKGLSYAVYQQLDDEESFKQTCEQLISKRRICEHYGIGMDLVNSLFKRYGIESKPSAIVRSLNNRQRREAVPVTHENFIRLHHQENKPLYQVANEMGISPNFLRQKVKDEWGDFIRDTRISLEFRDFQNKTDAAIQKEVNKRTIQELCSMYKVSLDTMRQELMKRNIILPNRYSSSGELEIGDILEQQGFNIIRNDRHLIKPQEVDILIPNLNIAIEYCGLYWHSEDNGKDRDYHLLKHQRCENRGVRLITIFEDEYIRHPEIVKSKILSILGTNNIQKINGRDCHVKEISALQKRVFLNDNHIQGDDRSSVFLGLFYDQRLVAVMTFAKPSRVRSSKAMVNRKNLWELNRFATDITLRVRGAAGKLLSFFKQNYQWDEIYSYADKRWSKGDVYFKLGFTHVHDSPPNYWYVKPGICQREYRYNYTKYKLVEQGFDKNRTEIDIMRERGYTRIWDCGTMKFIMQK